MKRFKNLGNIWVDGDVHAYREQDAGKYYEYDGVDVWERAGPPVHKMYEYFFHGVTFCPVSYTHLDVYKRQILSREVFQLELAQSGYHQLLGELRQKALTYEGALGLLEGQLGAEGKAVLRGMYLNNDE